MLSLCRANCPFLLNPYSHGGSQNLLFVIAGVIRLTFQRAHSSKCRFFMWVFRLVSAGKVLVQNLHLKMATQDSGVLFLVVEFVVASKDMFEVSGRVEVFVKFTSLLFSVVALWNLVESNQCFDLTLSLVGIWPLRLYWCVSESSL